MSNDPESTNIGRYDAGEYLLTAAKWHSPVTGISYEIGIRNKSTMKFWLLQNRKWDFQSVQEVANMVATMLADKTQCYDPDWMQKYVAE